MADEGGLADHYQMLEELGSKCHTPFVALDITAMTVIDIDFVFFSARRELRDGMERNRKGHG